MDSIKTIEALLAELASLEVEVRRQEERSAREQALAQTRIDSLTEHAADEAKRAGRLQDDARALGRDLEDARSALQVTERELTALGHATARHEKTIKNQGERLRAQQELLQTLSAGIAEVRRNVDRIAASRSWRVGHRLALAADRVRLRKRVTPGAVVVARQRLARLSRAAARATEITGANARGGGADSLGLLVEPELDRAERSALAERVRMRLGPAPRRWRWPMVSMVVLNRNGDAHLRRLIDGLQTCTDYPRFELIVVDNDSGDGSREFLRTVAPSFPVALLENAENVSFSVGNRQGAARARGELLLFLNNDIEPFERGWLREMVGLATREDIGAVGATLLHADKIAAGVPLVQHRGIRVRYQRERFQPYNLDDGGRLFSEQFGANADCPAATGACLMMRRPVFENMGGFPDGYRYGTEDVDLGLQLLTAGLPVLISGRAHLLHRESSTQNAEGREFKRRNRLANQRLFAERWSSRLRREYRASQLRGDRYWAETGGPHVAITVTSANRADGYGDWHTGHELGDSLELLGWRVTYVQRRDNAWYSLPDDLDYLIVLLDSYDLRKAPRDVLKVAWVRNWTDRWIDHEWFGDYDLVLASSRGCAEVIENRAGVKPMEFPLATNPRRFHQVATDAELAADLVFTGNRWARPRAVEALRARPGETVRVFGRGWEDVPGLAAYARGPVAYDRLPVVYSSAGVVVDDTAEHALPYGAINSRVFDALACGTAVATNCEAGVRELFDEEFPTWTDPASMRRCLDALLANPVRRDALALRYRQVVLDRHTYDHRARELVSLLLAAEQRLSFCIKAGAPTRALAAEWGDVHFGEALAQELRRNGHRAMVQVLDEWEDTTGLQYDVVIHLKGLSRYAPKHGQFNVLWCISHPDELSDAEAESYDLVCVASERFASALSARVSVPVEVLEQATDTRRFYPETDERYRHELLFVANSRKVMRPTMSKLLPTKRDLAVYGTNWSGLIDERYIAGEHIPNDQLRLAYSTARIVLNDHWDDMREHGFVSNRIYDALACGALVVSDHLPELEQRFGDSVVTYRDRAELHECIARLLRSPEDCAERGRRGRQAVLEGYTFTRRTQELLTLVARHAGDTRLIKTEVGTQRRLGGRAGSRVRIRRRSEVAEPSKNGADASAGVPAC